MGYTPLRDVDNLVYCVSDTLIQKHMVKFFIGFISALAILAIVFFTYGLPKFEESNTIIEDQKEEIDELESNLEEQEEDSNQTIEDQKETIEELTTDLEDQKKTVEELNEEIQTVNLEEQERCASQASKTFSSLGYSYENRSSYENHYNQKMNKCFINISSSYPDPDEVLLISRQLIDAYEGKSYANYLCPLLGGCDGETYPLCHVEEAECKTLLEFNTLVDAYMVD